MSTDLNSRSADLPARTQEANPPSSPAAPPQHWVCTPPIDIFETPEGLVLRADLPGVTAETLDVQVQDNKLTLLGRVAEQAPAGATLIHQEYHVGDFVRSFILSDDVDHDRITAKISNGVLDLLLPRIPKAEPRKIQVRVD